MANIRSNYIKNLLADKEELGKTLEESTKEALKGIVDEAVNKNLRSMISEAKEDDYEEEEVNDTENIVDEPETSEEEPKDEETSVEPEESGDDANAEDTEDGEGLWDSLEQYKSEDGEYDLTGMDSEDVIKVLRVMKPEDGVRVVKNNDGTIELTDEENDTEYVIEIGDDDIDVDVIRDEDNDDEEDVFDIEVDECGDAPMMNEGEVDLGYTDNYQNVTAMTMDPDDGEKTPKWNAGTPTGNGKRWVGNSGDMSPYNKKVNESDEPIVEVVLDDAEENLQEKAESVANGSRTAQDLHHDEDINAVPRHSRKRQNGKNATDKSSANEAFKRKVNAVLKENQQLKAIAEQIKNRLNEACVINASLGKIIKLVTENTTTRDEKINIVNRFNDVKTVKEGKALYEAIEKELKNSHPINNVDKVMSGPLTETKKTNIVETPMFQSADLTETLDLMKRLDKIK